MHLAIDTIGVRLRVLNVVRFLWVGFVCHRFYFCLIFACFFPLSVCCFPRVIGGHLIFEAVAVVDFIFLDLFAHFAFVFGGFGFCDRGATQCPMALFFRDAEFLQVLVNRVHPAIDSADSIY